MNKSRLSEKNMAKAKYNKDFIPYFMASKLKNIDKSLFFFNKIDN